MAWGYGQQFGIIETIFILALYLVYTFWPVVVPILVVALVLVVNAFLSRKKKLAQSHEA